MDAPKPPPTLRELLATHAHTLGVPELFERYSGAPMRDAYLPWDRMRFLTPPEGLTVEEWWFHTKLSRDSSLRPAPTLLTKDGSPFRYNLTDTVLEESEFVSTNASGTISISEQVTDASTRDTYLVSSLIEEAITSSQLEGAATSRRDAKDMLRSGRKPADRSEQMIYNNYLAMQHIIETQHEPLTPASVCELHRIVTDGTLDNPSSAGRLQDDDRDRVAVWGDGAELLHRPPPVAELPERLARLCEFANGDDDGGYMPAAVRAIIVHFMMGYDHYFEDGNGRTARALFYRTMLKEGFWLAEFLTISRILRKAPSQYASSYLHTEQDDGDLTYFILYHLDVLHRAIDELHVYLARKADELNHMQRSIRDLPGEFNYRQLAILEHAIKYPGEPFTVRTHSTTHSVTPQTARSDLAGLEAMHLLAQHKLGRKFIWLPVDNLAEKLKRRL